MITRRLGVLVTVIVLVASGAYLLVYLYRWEWNRALVAGVFFVAAEIALVATALLRKLQQIEQRLDAQESPTPLDRIRDVDPERRDHFAWLDPTQMNVFVPVLLGAGVILSVIAHGVERLAAATTTPVRQKVLADRLGAIALPDGGLLGPPVGLGPLVQPAVPRSWRTLVTRGFAVVLAAFLLGATIEVIADETQDRPDAADLGSAADITVHVDRRFTSRSELATAEALFVACRHNIGNSRKATDFALLGDGYVSFRVTPSFGEHAQRRFVGCLEDALFDRISASVVELDHIP